MSASAIDRVKELLEAAKKRVAWSFSAEKQQRHAEWNAANDKLRDIAIPLAQALVESQEYIEDQDCQNRRDYGGDFCIEWPKSNREDWCDRCVALDGLAKVMEEK